MENFIYSLNATVPVFLVMVIGYVFKQRKMLTDEFVAAANRFNFKVTLPVLLFCDISSMNLREMYNGKFIAFCMIVTTLCFIVIWTLSRLFIRDKSIIGSFVQGSFRGSAAVLGVAFIQNIYGNAGYAPLMIAASVPLYNMLSVVVLTFEGQGQQGGMEKKIKSALIGIVTNPLIIGIVLGLPFALFDLHLPAMLDKTLGSLAAMSTPLALVVIGAGFEGKKALKKLRPTLLSSLIKLVIQPAVFLPLAIWLGFRGEQLIAILIMLGAPTTPSTFIMAKNMGNDGVLATSLIVATTLLSAVTITGFIYLLKNLALI